MRYVMEHKDLVFYFDCTDNFSAIEQARKIVAECELDIQQCQMAKFESLDKLVYLHEIYEKIKGEI